MSNSPIIIRLATVADLQDVQTCARAAYSRYVNRIGQEPAPMIADFKTHIKRGHVYIVLYMSSFAGYVVFYTNNDCVHLDNIAISPSHSGQGIGKKLIEYVEQAARDIGKQAVELYTNEAMSENLAMYEKLGYIETERKQQMGFRRVFFRKDL